MGWCSQSDTFKPYSARGNAIFIMCYLKASLHTLQGSILGGSVLWSSLGSSRPGSHPEVVITGTGVDLEVIWLKLPRWLQWIVREETHCSGVQGLGCI